MDYTVASSSSSNSMENTADPPPSGARKKLPGGWRAIKYILGNESFEKLASIGLIANLTVYLQKRYNMDGIQVVNVFNIWSGSSNVTPLFGAFLSDAYLGKFYTLLFGSISSFLGMVILTLTAGVRNFTPVACINGTNCQDPLGWQLAILYIGLGLLAVGAGGIRPCNIAFGADQFDTTTEKGRNQLTSFFNWWYFSFTVALVIALTLVVYIQSNVSWTVGYAIPAGCLFFSIIIFLIGKHSYIIHDARGSIFIDMTKVFVAACRKRKVSLVSSSRQSLYDPLLIDYVQQETKLARTDKFKFLDKAAVIVDPSELDNQGVPKNSWRLCSLQQVEQLKLLLGIVPVWFTGIGCFITMDQMNTFGLMQALQSDNVVHNFKIPQGWMGLISMIALSIWIFSYEQIYLPVAKKRSTKDKRLTMRQRINTGIVMAILCMLVAGVVERHRRGLALKQGSFVSPMSMLLLLPQFALSGLDEAFAAVAVMEYFTTHLPETMRTIAGAIFFLSFSAASYINAALVNLVHNLSGKHGKTPWLGGRDLNKVRLDYFYYLIAILAALNLFYFNLFSYRFLSKETDEDSASERNEKRSKAIESV